MPVELGQRYFDRIKEIWSWYGTRGYRVIPFCTPVISNPGTLVIGTNHSDFVDGGGGEADRIAEEYAARVPKSRNTYRLDRHKFAVGLTTYADLAGITIDDTWVGTNRCAVQTGPEGIDEVRNLNPAHFDVCQGQMDAVIKDLVAEICPRNIILAGKFAAELFYPEARNRRTKFEHLPPKDEVINEGGRTSRLLAIQPPSRHTINSFREQASQRLAAHFIR